ncbi:MAG: GTPase domain-containing protein [Bacillota bacterium]
MPKGSMCPYCFKIIWKNNVVFRKKDGEKVTDEYIKAYEKNKGNEDFSRNDYKYVDPAFFPEHEKKYSDSNLLLSIRDKTGNELDDRLCPYCHSEFHTGFGERETFPFSVIGNTNAGKTTYLSAISKQVKNSIFLNLIHVGGEKTIERYGEVLDKTEFKDLSDNSKSTVAFLGPYIYDAITNIPVTKKTPKKKDATLVFYDLPGESFKNPEDISKNASYISHSSGWIFLIDPTMDHKNAVSVFDSIYNSFIASGNRHKTNIALVINKGDLLTDIGNDEYFTAMQQRTYFEKEPLDLQLVKKNSDEIRRVIVNKSGDLRALEANVSKFFGEKNFSWFITSCFNQDGFKPINCEEPFYWLLSKIGLYPSVDGPTKT